MTLKTAVKLLLFLLVIFSHVPADSISCSVPEVENGEIGRLDVLNSRGSGEDNFINVLVGENVRSNETLFLRCREGFYPTKDSVKFLESNLIEVTCKGGTWSDVPQCKQTNCTTTPPSGKNSLPIVRSRQHGYSIWYSCTTRYAVKQPGNVTCHFGSWIGIATKCFQNPCRIDDLNYPGLIKPSEQYLDSDESFDVHCQNGFFIKAASVKKINCNEGLWVITQNPCTREREHRPSLTAPSENAPSIQEVHPIANVESSDQQNTDRECFCTYNYENDFVKARVGHKILKRGDKIMPGETVSFECRFICGVLSWQNGLRFHGKVNMVCSICQNWISEDLPSCNNIGNGDAVIGYEEDLKILPGGVVEIRKGDSYQFSCSSRLGQPQWDYGEREDIAETNAQIRGHGDNIYLSYLDVSRAKEGHTGIYECFTKDEFGDPRASSILELQVDATDIRCPLINGSGFVSIYYSNNRRINSTANFRCLDNDKRLDGCSTATCLPNGTWTLCYATCVATDIRCPPINGAGVFSIHYSNNRRINSSAQFMCLENYKRIDGCHTAACLPNGTWTPCYPTCVGYIFPGYTSRGCPRFRESVYLRVLYSKGTSVGSVAAFSCSPSSKVLVGDSRSVCQANGKWSHPPASCEESSCSLGDLVISEDVEPDMTDINGEFIPYGSEVKLKCRDSAIISGNSVALCKESGRWELGNYQCVIGCVLNIEPSSHLLAQPLKESYRFGEFVLLSCPRGKKMSVVVERLMCMGDSWSDTLPNCIDLKQAGQL